MMQTTQDQWTRPVQRAARALALTALVGAALAAAPTAQDDPPSVFEGAYLYDVAPIEAEPDEAWRVPVDGVLSEPAAQGDLVWVVVGDGRTRELVALDMFSGERVHEVGLKRGERAHVYIAGEFVVVADTELIETYLVDEKGRLKKQKTFKGPWSGEPTIHGGLLIANDQKRKVHVIDIESGKSLGKESGGYGQPAVIPGDDPSTLSIITLDFGGNPGYLGTYLRTTRSRIEGIGGRKITFEAEQPEYIAVFDQEPDADGMHDLVFTRWQHVQDADTTGFFIFLPVRIRPRTGDGTRAVVMNADASAGSLVGLESRPAFDGANHYGFDAEGNVYRVPVGSGGSVLKKAEYLHADVRPGPGSSARDGVVHIGNLAMYGYNGETIWIAEDADVATRLTPVADGRVLYASLEGELVCMVDPNIARSLASAREPEVVSPLELAATVRPGSEDGVFLREGLFVPGDFDIGRDGSGSLELESGETFDLAGRGAAATWQDDAFESFGDEVEYPVFAAWRHALYGEYAATLDELFTTYLEDGFAPACDRVIRESENIGMPARWVAGLQARLDEARDGLEPGSASKLERTTSKELQARAAIREEFKAAADWCIEHDLELSATALLAQGNRILPGDDEIRAASLSLVPASFPYADRPDAWTKWLEWSIELLPAAGEFIGEDDPFWESVEDTVWERGPDSFGLRSANITLLCRDTEPRVIGECLRYAEATVRSLEELLGYDDYADSHPNRNKRLELRVHRNRKEYLEERSPTGSLYAIPWSAGFYSPADQISRFYVEKGEFTTDPLGRSMFQTLAHEVTHHFLDMRWIPDSSYGVAQNGYWVVEGFASFVGDQIADLDEGPTTFDDPTVDHVGTVALAADSTGVFPVGDLVDATRQGFDTLDSSEGSMGSLSQIGMFYEQAATLTFFLFNESGEEGPERVVSYMRDFYRGRTADRGWERLGYDSADAIQEAFFAFLKRSRMN